MTNEIPTYAFENSKNNLVFEIQTLGFFIRNTRAEQVGTPHRIDFYCILFITKGTGRHIINFEQYNYEPGDILFMAKNQVVKFRLSQDSEGYILFFQEEFLHQNSIQFNDLYHSFPFNFGLYVPVIKTGLEKLSFERFFKLAHKEFGEQSTFNSVEVLQCLLRAILLKVSVYGSIPAPRTNNVSKKGMNLFIDFQRLVEQPRICSRNADSFCQDLGVSYKHLNSLCKRLTGKTLKTFIDDNFVLKAKRMLIHSNSNISEIAFSLGFEEVTNFTKYFKKHANKTPTEFQNGNH